MRVKDALVVSAALIAGIAASHASDETAIVPAFKPDNRTYDEIVEAVKAYESIPASRDAEVIEELTRNKNANPPPYAYELARRLLPADESEALYVMAVAVLRATYDGKRCKDDHALAGIFELAARLRVQAEAISKPIEGVRTGEGFMDQWERVKDRNEIFDSTASPFWVCSHGLGLSQSEAAALSADSDAWLKPADDWIAIQAEIRAELDKAIAKHRANRHRDR